MKVTQLCLTLCDPMDCSLLGSSVHGILQARILEWVAISFFRDLPDSGLKPTLGKSLICFVSLYSYLVILDISHTWAREICGLLWLVFSFFT